MSLRNLLPLGLPISLRNDRSEANPSRPRKPQPNGLRSTLRNTLVIAFLASHLPLPVLALDWDYLSMDGKLSTCIVEDSVHSRILDGTIEGFHYLDQASGLWTDRDWEGSIGRVVHSIDWHPDLDQRVVTGRENGFFKGYIEVSDDLGETEQNVYNSDGGSVTDLVHDEFFHYACTWSDVIPGEFVRSTNGGGSWTLMPSTGHHAMTSMALSHDGILYVGGSSLVTRSFDQGQTWESAAGDLPAGLGIYCVATYPLGTAPPPGHLFASNDLGLYESFDQGDHWHQVLPDDCRNIAIYPTDIGLIAVATFDGRVKVSRDGGANWDDETGLLPGTPIDLTFSVFDNSLYVVTSTNGVFRSNPVITGLPGESASADRLSLEVWPNPVASSADLRFRLPREGRVTLSLYDIAGRRIRSLLDDPIPAGFHSLPWAPADLPTGTYWLNLSAPSGETRLRITRLE